MPNGLFIINKPAFPIIYTSDVVQQLSDDITFPDVQLDRSQVYEHRDLLEQTEVIFSGWSMAKMDAEFLAACPRLKAVFYGAGSVRSFTTDAFWESGIRLTSAYAANAIPVAEFTLANILLSLKLVFRLHRECREWREFPWHTRDAIHGNYDATVGLISLGMIGRRVIEFLRPFRLNVIAYDPFISDADVDALGIQKVDTLIEVFERSDVVSLHTPLLPETIGMIRGEHFNAMKPNATFINTARGSIVREDEMITAIRERKDIQVILDVMVKEPPDNDSPLYTLPNVAITPHIAGSLGHECRRMGQYMLEEWRRYRDGLPMKFEITRELAKRLA